VSTDVMSDILGVEMQAVEVDAQRHQQANLDETDRQTDGRTDGLPTVA